MNDDGDGCDDKDDDDADGVDDHERPTNPNEISAISSLRDLYKMLPALRGPSAGTPMGFSFFSTKTTREQPLFGGKARSHDVALHRAQTDQTLRNLHGILSFSPPGSL